MSEDKIPRRAKDKGEKTSMKIKGKESQEADSRAFEVQ